MSATLEQAGSRALAHFQAVRDRLPGCPDARVAAAEVFRSRGLPSRRDEAWRYTSLRDLGATSFAAPEAEVSPDAAAEWISLTRGLPRIVFVNGRLRPELSSLPAAISLGSFEVSAPKDATAAALPFVALNTMFAEDGMVITVDPDIECGPVVLLALTVGGNVDMPAVCLRHRIALRSGARLTLVEVAAGSGRYFANCVMEAEVADGAKLSHVRIQRESIDATTLSTLFVDASAGATYDSFTLALGGKLARAEVHARLAGPGATVHLNAAQLLAGSQHADVTTVVSHDAPACASRQTVKNILADRAHGVFQGKIEVARAAQKTDGYQMNQALLLSPEAEIDSKPELEIFADDVKCSHGATVGELDGDQIFYLRSRGVPERDARTLLIRAFLAESLADIEDAEARRMAEDALEGSWEKLGR
ncbi:Fe-S cluster assembly protein SufD [Acidisphaera rubrifaciens]|uniref:Iron-sulfur (Fe-S) assembly protein SufD n=1 Tax=Acidisphaera rubrifaciens HS-AP3 TaxID=1231350 RepID=A0A0D6P2P5_9PROT|nr:Fe-S cluster assembly protein SufD [Acidisphaera rubrifaciens]GAN76040.1 iron-sulfur (Fe-S) assembly protein SufD [Acidisphaera rubrifaciens HS-AP3]